MSENFSNWTKKQCAHLRNIGNSSSINTKKSTSKYIMGKDGERENLESSKTKMIVSVPENPSQTSSGPLLETVEAGWRRQWNGIFKVLKGKNPTNQGSYIQQNSLPTMKVRNVLKLKQQQKLICCQQACLTGHLKEVLADSKRPQTIIQIHRRRPRMPMLVII